MAESALYPTKSCIENLPHRVELTCYLRDASYINHTIPQFENKSSLTHGSSCFVFDPALLCLLLLSIHVIWKALLRTAAPRGLSDFSAGKKPTSFPWKYAERCAARWISEKCALNELEQQSVSRYEWGWGAGWGIRALGRYLVKFHTFLWQILVRHPDLKLHLLSRGN